MTKKDYILIASVLKNKYETVKNWNNIDCQSLSLAYIEDFAKMLKVNNKRFDKVKFYKLINKDFLIN